jgi:biopolymer transport protein ExbD
MTPMVDIVMVILIFFMAATTFAGDEWFLRAGLLRDAPAAPAAAPAGDPFTLPPVRLTIMLEVDDAGETIGSGVGTERVALEQLLGALAAFCDGAATGQIVLIIAADPAAPYRDVVRVHDAATALGITRIAMQTD